MASQREGDSRVEDDVPRWTFGVYRGHRDVYIGSVTVAAPSKPEAVKQALKTARKEYPTDNDEFLEADSEIFMLAK